MVVVGEVIVRFNVVSYLEMLVIVFVLNFSVKILYMSIFFNIMSGGLIFSMIMSFVIVVGLVRLMNTFFFGL